MLRRNMLHFIKKSSCLSRFYFHKKQFIITSIVNGNPILSTNKCNNYHTSRTSFPPSDLLGETLKLKDVNMNNSIIDNNIKKLCYHYNCLGSGEKDEFLKNLSVNYSSDYNAVRKTASSLICETLDDVKFIRIKEKLQNELTPPYRWLFIHIGRQVNGVKFLVDLRSDLLRLLRQSDTDKLHLLQLDKELRQLLLLWFSVGFLQLQRITWQSSCEMLQKISDYEAVHPVRSWTDLKKRVGEDRRCFVYTHSSMPAEPLVVLHTALRPEISDSVAGLVRDTSSSGANKNHCPSAPNSPRAAVFYSISATQTGLQGIELGNYIIKRAATELLKEFPTLDSFSTLSPVPNFKSWLFDKLKFAENDERLLGQLFGGAELSELRDILAAEDVLLEIRKQLSSNSWLHVPALVQLLRPVLLRLCLRYLYREKKRGYALCPVANFHLRNGAEMWRVNWLADVTPRGLQSSCGLMVNYRYRLELTDGNSLRYIRHKEMAISPRLLRLAESLQAGS